MKLSDKLLCYSDPTNSLEFSKYSFLLELISEESPNTITSSTVVRTFRKITLYYKNKLL